MTCQILSFVHPELILCYERNAHFFSWRTGKEVVRDTLEALEIVRTTFEWMPQFLTDDDLITTLYSGYIQLHPHWSGLYWLTSNLRNQI